MTTGDGDCDGAAPAFTRAFVEGLRSSAAARHGGASAVPDLPEYDYRDRAELDSLIQLSRPQSFRLGTGASIFTQALLPAVLSAKHEVVLVTCFWAKSRTLSSLGATLVELARRRQRAAASSAGRGQGQGEGAPPLRVRICLSSRSFFQRLFHPSSRDGYVYPPSAWPTQLGLPSRDVIEAGNIDLVVKSLFFLPFSVMHPKFLVVDRRRAFIPSCNVSWESWLEGCLEISSPPAGPDAVGGLLEFYRRTWEKGLCHAIPGVAASSASAAGDATGRTDEPSHVGVAAIVSPAQVTVSLSELEPVTTVWLPSSHHCNPQFRPFPWQTAVSPPATPLNVALLQLLETAQRDVFIETPNLTAAPAITAILCALSRGVDVTIVTSRNMMLLEQLVTAGTTTTWCVWRLIARYQSLRACRPGNRERTALGPDEDLEAQHQAVAPGCLRISYFHPRESGVAVADEEPVHSHLKLMIVDGQFTVLGSGNLDRASWYTSQELGVLLCGSAVAEKVRAAVDKVLLEARLDVIFDSTTCA
ncbi:Phospholipase D/nuclease [Pleurostoma richardsiae]|uniref:Phospholipase D/nuclease n=1 Tax=Pleurostoma richardsiae TaxID=41990 RepID=A0AA38RK05_9PEZI|nr:Phospholipase D/nuclease [Pleurostoma richardsiae]